MEEKDEVGGARYTYLYILGSGTWAGGGAFSIQRQGSVAGWAKRNLAQMTRGWGIK